MISGDPDRYLTPAQVGELLQVKEDAVRRLLRTGQLRGRRVGRVWRVPESAVHEFMRQPEVPPTNPFGLTSRSAARLK